MRINVLFFLCIVSFICPTFAQEAYLSVKSEENKKTYPGGEEYKVTTFPQKFKSKKPNSIILLIGDGMGVAHIFAGITANHGNLFMGNCKYIGFSKTQSANSYITDSAAGGTALSTGIKTNNGAVGVDVNNVPLKTILEEAEEKGLATGLVSTSMITHATPASFIAHQPSREMYEEIAADFLKTDIDVFIGGGRDNFKNRKDNRNLLEELETKGYIIEQDINKIAEIKTGKLVGLTEALHNKNIKIRKDMLPIASETAIHILDNNKKGFFLMIEGSFIDWGGHAGNFIQIIEEMEDFDRAVGKALEYAANDGETLVIITADHETGGMALTGGDNKSGRVNAEFASTGHTGVMVPVFSYGPGAEEFIGIMDNTDIYKKMKMLLLK